MAEYLQILTRLLDPQGQSFDYHGHYFQLENAGLARRLPAPEIILDQHEAPALLSTHASLCLLDSATPPLLQAQIAHLRHAAAPRTPGFALPLGIIVRETAEQAWEAALHSGQLDRPGIAAAAPGVLALQRSDHPLRAFEVYPQLYACGGGRPLQLVGSVSQVVGRLEELHGLGITRIIIDSEPAVAEVLRVGELLLPALAHLRPRPRS